MLSISQLKSLLAKHGLMPSKRLGQNFLINERALEDLVKAANISPSGTIVEVGGGVGTITEKLAERAGRVVVVEKDKNLAPILRERMQNFENVEVIEGDILTFDTKYEIPNTRYALIGAPPYYLTARLFRKFLEEEKIRPSRIAFIIQKEVAQKICAQAPDMNLLALSVQIYGTPKIVREVSRGCFWPQPSVDSALLTVDVFPNPQVAEGSLPEFFRIAKAAFASPRKQLQNTLQKIFPAQGGSASGGATENILRTAAIDPARRPETLTLEEWEKLAEISLRREPSGSP